MALGLAAMGDPIVVKEPAPGPWCREAPLWGNPILQLDRTGQERTIPWPAPATPPPATEPPAGPSHTGPASPFWATGFCAIRELGQVRTVGEALALHRQTPTLLRLGLALARTHLGQGLLAVAFCITALALALPAAWRAAADTPTTQPSPPAAALRQVVGSLGWADPLRRGGVLPICSESFSVRSATACMTARARAEQLYRRSTYATWALAAGPASCRRGSLLQPSLLRVDSAVSQLGRDLSSLWLLPSDNSYKEPLWRLCLNGIRGRHRATCPCGWAAHRGAPAAQGGVQLPADPGGARQAPIGVATQGKELQQGAPATVAFAESCASRLHRFWDCPVAVAVVSELQRCLGWAALTCADSTRDVWLLRFQGPREDIHSGIWQVACTAAIAAMERGRKALWRLTRDPVTTTVRAIAMASKEALAFFWLMLQDFVELEAPPEWPRPHQSHPFMEPRPGTGYHLQLHLPVEYLLPANIGLD